MTAVRLSAPRGYTEASITLERDGEDITVEVCGSPTRAGAEDIRVLSPAGLELTDDEIERVAGLLCELASEPDEDRAYDEWRDA